ncbi:Protein of unknown function DUF262 [Streptomyces sp. cf386]|uniref:DUF262 domain-containing protein n=1 Tax=Streptomyces sp. cf386 TaxID=1761904 RepID=UPI0008833A6D|nr:DUF262 domain-containing protein [Streptomyces sp. cf386]SDP45932.1 Protein of unknown function DUF262 [Streptomyces sp. cf386]
MADNEQPGAEVETEDDEHVLDIDAEEEVLTVTYEITSYGADYPVDGLVKRLDRGDVQIPSFNPAYTESDEIRGFQRGFVWNRPQMDRFIESLLLGLPVPGVFLVREKSNALLVLDGQQRLRSLQAYYSGIHAGREYRLKYAQEPFYGKTYEELDDEDRRRLDDSIIHATVLRQDSPTGSQQAIYSIFERLNTGGSPLQPQEIRIALFNGPFLQLLGELNEDPNWRELYGPPSKRYKDHELTLRVFALFEEFDSYFRPVKGFLNQYLENNRDRTPEDSEELAGLFRAACRHIYEAIGARAFKPVRALNAAVLDSVMVGVMQRLASGDITSHEQLKQAYEALMINKEYRAATTYSTAGEESVAERIQLSTDAFASVA